MRKRAWWLAAALLVVAPVAALGVALAVLEPDDYKPQIAAAVQQATGRALTLEGPLRVSRSLWPTIEVDGAKLANLPGGTRPDMARAERIEAQLSLPALLWGRIEVTRLTLVGPNILFELVDGRPNWVLDPETVSVEPAPAPSASLGGMLRFRGVDVRNGMVTLRLPQRTRVVGIRALDVQHRTDGGPLTLSGVLVYGDYQPFSLQASAVPTDGTDGPWRTRVGFSAYDATASAEGTMALAGTYDLQVEAQAPMLDRLNALLPEMRLPALRQAALSTHLVNIRKPGDLPVIGTTRLRFASADLGDRVPGLALGASELSLPAAGGQAALSGTGRYAGQAFTLGGTVGVPEHLDGRVKLPIDLTLRAQPASLSLKGRLALDAGRFDGLDAATALRTPTLAALRPTVSRALPALTDVTLDGRLVVPPDAGSLGLRGAKLSAGEGDLTGDMTIGLGPTPALAGELRAARLDLDALLTAFGWQGAAAPAAAGGPVFPDTPLPWAMLRGPTLELTASVASLAFRRQVWRDMHLALQLKGGRLQVSRLQMALPGGPLEAALTADAAQGEVPVSLTLQAPGLPLALVAHAAGLPGPASGALRIEARLHGAARTARSLAASLDGPFAATMTGGSLSNAALVRLAGPALQALSIPVPAQGDTVIGCLGLVGTFTRGVGRFRTIALATTYLELDGAGQVDLAAETLALKLRPLARLSGASVSVPVVVDGPFRAIGGRLDASGLDKLGLLIDAWFGGDRPETCAEAGLLPRPAPLR